VRFNRHAEHQQGQRFQTRQSPSSCPLP
jgi:hypothetical protein